MESDLPLIQMAEEVDSLIQHFPDLDQTPFKSSLSCSPFALPPSYAKNLKDGVHMEKPSSSSSEAINNKENINSNSVEVPKLGMEPMQMKRRKKGAGYNLRKSLAWDRAFFTDEGILDPVELTLITGIDANTCGGGLPTISEEGNSSFSSDASCTNDKNRTPKGNREKTDCSMRNHSSLLHHKVTHKALSNDRTNRGASKVGGCSEPLAASSLKRPANSNTLKIAKKESKLPKLPISKPGSCFYATANGSIAASQLRHTLIPKPTKNVDQNFGLKSSLQNVHGSQSKAKTAPGNVHFPVRELPQKTVKNLTHSSKAASSTRSRLVHGNRANSGSESISDTLQFCKVQEQSASLAAEHLAQHAASNSNNPLPEAARLTSSGPCHIQRASKGLMISDRLNPCESQERPDALARPSGLRLPSPSLRLFDQKTASQSGSLQQRKIQHYVGSERKCGEPWPRARTSMKSNDITENVGSAVLASSKECCAPSTQSRPSPNYMLQTSTKGTPYSNIYQNPVTKVVPRIGIKLEYECKGSEQKKKVFEQEEKAATWKGDEGIKVSHTTEQSAGNVGTCCGMMSESRVPETSYKSVLHNEKDGLQRCTAFAISTSGQSIQHQEENISAGADDLAQTSWEQVDTEKSDDAPKVNSESHFDAGSQVFVESQVHDEIRKREDDVGTTKAVSPGIESHSIVLQHGQEKDVSKVVDDKSLPMEEDNGPCSRTISMEVRDSHSLEREADVIDLKGIDTSIPYQNLNTEQRNDDADGVDVFPTTTTSPCVRDLSAEEGNDTHINPATFIRSKAQLHDSPVRDTIVQFLNDNPSTEGFNIGPTTSFENEHQLPVTLLLHDNPSSPDRHLIPTNSIKNKCQLQDTGTANGCSKRFEATTPCISVLLNSQLSEEGTLHNVTDISDHLSQEKSVSSAILSEVPGQKQDGFDVDLIPREVATLPDDHNQSGGFSHLRPQVKLISETASVADDAFLKREPVLQGAQCSSTYPQSLEKESLDIAAPKVASQHKIPVENHTSQEMSIIVVDEKSQDSRGNISEAKPTVQGCTGGSESQSENQTVEGSGLFSSISKTNVENGQMQLLDGDVLVPSCSRLMSEVHNDSIKIADHCDTHGKQAGFSNSMINMERVSKSNHGHFQQESVCKAVWNVVEGTNVYECYPTSPNTIIVDAAPPVVEKTGNSGGQLCVEYRTSGSIVTDSIAEHNENYIDGQSTECVDLTLTLDSELEPLVGDKTFVENSTCMEYCSAGEESCSFPADSVLDEKTTLSLDDQVLMKDSLLLTENVLDNVVDPEENSDTSAKIWPVVQVNGDNQPQGFSVSQEPTTGVETTSTPKLCCLVGGGDESLLTKTSIIEAEGSKIIVGEQVDATLMVGEFQHELDDVKDHKDTTVLAKGSNSIKMQDKSLVIHPPNAVPFSDEWLAAFEAAGEEILTMKCGAVQHSPPDKSLPEPSPWSPVKKKGNQIGPYDCTKYTNAMQ